MLPDQPGPGGFLPPEPPGDEPDLGSKPPREQPAYQSPEQPGYQPPPGYYQPPAQQGYQPPPPGWYPQQAQGQPAEPDNGPAVAGFVMAVIAAGLLVISFLLLAFVSLVLAIFGLVYSRRGKRKVEAGETGKHKGLAQAGFIISIVTLVIAVPVTILEIVFVIAYATDEQFREDFQDEWEQEFDTTTVMLVASTIRLAARLIA